MFFAKKLAGDNQHLKQSFKLETPHKCFAK